MSWFKLGRWTLLGAAVTLVSAACGGRNELPTQGNVGVPGDDLGGAYSTGNTGSGGSASVAGNATTGGAAPVAGSVSTGGVGAGGVGAMGGAPIGGAFSCAPGLGFCEEATLMLCDPTGRVFVPTVCPMGLACQPTQGGARCAPQVCVPGELRCDPAGEVLEVCVANGTSWALQQECAAQGQRCFNGACRGTFCQPNQRFCGAGGVRLCNAEGSAASLLRACGADEYCDAQSLSCKPGICDPNQPACNGDVATFCNANGSGYLMGGIDCAGQLGRTCIQGKCACGVDQLDCDGIERNGCEVDVSTDVNNCGGCGLVCSKNHVSNRSCDGACNGTCQMGYRDCNGDKRVDGCETNVTSDAKNCGGCGASCSTNHIKASCSAGVCNGACAANFNDCNGDKQKDGCESDQRTDAKNCGGCGNACPAGQGCSNGKCGGSLYSFSGIAQDLPVSKLVGWTLCYQDTYANSGVLLDKVRDACAGSLLMMACRVKGSSSLQLAAYAPRADVLFDTGNANATHDANGVSWYFSPSTSWGFAPKGDPVERFTCDTQDSTIGNGGVDGDRRLCWHTQNSALDGGWRCGYDDQLNSSAEYERLLFTAP